MTSIALAFYDLFKDVDRRLSAILVILVSISSAIAVASGIFLMAPLLLLDGPDFLSVFTEPQRDALAYAFIRLRHFGLSLNEAFWGLWLLPLGMLVIKSRFFPRFLGAWLIAGGVAWVAISFVNIVLPDYSKLAFNAAQPFTLAEVAAMIWLIKGPSVGSSVASSAAVP